MAHEDESSQCTAKPRMLTDKSAQEPLQQRLKRQLKVALTCDSICNNHKPIKMAYYLIRNGNFDLPQQPGTRNKAQCLGLLLHASKLQQQIQRKEQYNFSEKNDDVTNSKPKIILYTGAAGTGKTALMQACDVLTEMTFTEGAVLRSAPTRTAARLQGGDTCHAAYKLPLRSSSGTAGKLTDTGRIRLQEKFEIVEEHTIDEVSMLGPERLYRARRL